MKSIRRFIAAALLTSVFACAALGDDGIMHGDRMPTPTPTPPALMSNFGDDSPATAEAPSGDEVTATDITIQYALSVLGEMFLLY